MSYGPPSNDAVVLSGRSEYRPPPNDSVKLSPFILIDESALVVGSGNINTEDTAVASDSSVVSVSSLNTVVETTDATEASFVSVSTNSRTVVEEAGATELTIVEGFGAVPSVNDAAKAVESLIVEAESVSAIIENADAIELATTKGDVQSSAVGEILEVVRSVSIVRQTYSSAPNDAVVLSGTSGYTSPSNNDADLSPLPGTEGVGVNIDTQERTVAQERPTVVGVSSIDAVVRGFADESVSATLDTLSPRLGDVGVATDQLRVSATTGASLVEKVILVDPAIEVTGVIGAIAFEQSVSGAVTLEQSASGKVGLEQSASGTADIEQATAGDTDNGEDS